MLVGVHWIFDTFGYVMYNFLIHKHSTCHIRYYLTRSRYTSTLQHVYNQRFDRMTNNPMEKNSHQGGQERSAKTKLFQHLFPLSTPQLPLRWQVEASPHPHPTPTPISFRELPSLSTTTGSTFDGFGFLFSFCAFESDSEEGGWSTTPDKGSVRKMGIGVPAMQKKCDPPHYKLASHKTFFCFCSFVSLFFSFSFLNCKNFAHRTFTKLI